MLNDLQSELLINLGLM